jgi:hypothetical protein
MKYICNEYKIFFFILFLLFFSQSSFADMGPKPTADIILSKSRESIDSAFSALLACEKDYCTGEDCNTKPSEEELKEMCEFENDDACTALTNIWITDTEKDCTWQHAPYIWGGNCQDSICHFNYMIPTEFRLAVYLPSEKKTYLSEKVYRENFHSTFIAELNNDKTITITDTTPLLKTTTYSSFILSTIMNMTSLIIGGFLFFAIFMIVGF